MQSQQWWSGDRAADALAQRRLGSTPGRLRERFAAKGFGITCQPKPGMSNNGMPELPLRSEYELALCVERHGNLSISATSATSEPDHQASARLSTIRRKPCTERRVVTIGSEGACVSIVSVNGPWCAGKVAANSSAKGMSPSPTGTNCRAAVA